MSVTVVLLILLLVVLAACCLATLFAALWLDVEDENARLRQQLDAIRPPSRRVVIR